MKYQLRPWYCGPATLANACYLVGLKCPGQHAIARMAGTIRKGGTDETAMMRGAMALGMHVDPVSISGESVGEFSGWLKETLDYWPVALCVDNWDHWVLAFAHGSDYFVVMDPSNSENNVKVGGIRVYNEEKLLKRVYAGRKVANGLPPYYGIALYKNNKFTGG